MAWFIHVLVVVSSRVVAFVTVSRSPMIAGRTHVPVVSQHTLEMYALE